MKTNVIMERSIWENTIRQRTDNGFFCASDLVNAGQQWRLKNKKKFFNYSMWLKSTPTQEFIKELEKQLNMKVIIKGNAKNSISWIHPYLFIDLALSISPKLKVETYQWLYDKLIEYRNTSGDSYRKMSGAIAQIETNQSLLKEHIQETALKIKNELGVEDWNKATEEQLKLRDKIHEYISILSDIIKDRNTLINVAIKKAIENK